MGFLSTPSTPPPPPSSIAQSSSWISGYKELWSPALKNPMKPIWSGTAVPTN
jgi:hypothetical protein